MNIAITGATGFVGRHLSKTLAQDGHQITDLGRSDFRQGNDHLKQRLQGCAVVINLAGETINRRWTPDYKQRIFDSRIQTTRQLVAAMMALENKPKLFFSTSAIGAFCQERCYNEADAPDADDFLGRLSKDWEAAANVARDAGIRTLIFRFGLVLGHDGGLLLQLLPPFMLGLGGPVGGGRQHFSWIHVDDLVEAYRFVLDHPEMSGVYHLCAPTPVSNQVFAKTLGRVLRRPAIFPVPVALLQLIYGEGAEVMASGQCVVSDRLPGAGFRFRYPDLKQALPAVVAAARVSNLGFKLMGIGARP